MDSSDPKASLVKLVLEQHASTASADHATRQALRSELDGLRLMALQKRAVDAGVDDKDLENAMDTADPKAALIALILALPNVDAAKLVDGPQLSLTSELTSLEAKLGTLCVSELRRRAKTAGVAEDALEEATDADDAKAAVISLLLETLPAGEDKPHFGSARAAANAPVPVPVPRNL
eukprot:SAG31_NODE_19227_length_609_cov_0.625490_1_plen_177_part_10